MHTGWLDLEHRSVFLHAGGALGSPGIQTRLSGRLGQYSLPENPRDVPGAVRQSLRFLDIASRKLTLPIFSAVYRAPTQSLLPCDSTIWACGHTGTLKTTAASLAAAHFGRFERNTLPAGWHDTAAHIEYTMFLAKDVLLV